MYIFFQLKCRKGLVKITTCDSGASSARLSSALDFNALRFSHKKQKINMASHIRWSKNLIDLNILLWRRWSHCVLMIKARMSKHQCTLAVHRKFQDTGFWIRTPQKNGVHKVVGRFKEAPWWSYDGVILVLSILTLPILEWCDICTINHTSADAQHLVLSFKIKPKLKIK